MCSNSAGRRVCAAKFCCLPYRSDRRRKSSGQRKPPRVYVSWPFCLSFGVNARLSELGRRDSQEKLGQRRGMRYVRSGQRGIVPHTHQSRAELRITTTTARDAIRQLTDQASIRLVSGHLSQSPLPPKTVRPTLRYPWPYISASRPKLECRDTR